MNERPAPRSRPALLDISPPITPSLAVWPGDTPPSREVLLDIGRGDPITLSTLHATVHLGSHADAPSHYGLNAESIDRVPLERYLGPAQVIRLEPGPVGILDSDALAGRAIEAERVLIRTGSYPDPTRFREDFTALSPGLVDRLADLGVRLIGVDTPSVDRFDSKDLPAHQACLRRGIAILEGLVLEDVPDGLYELCALPLRLVGFDASPVRAVLRALDR